MFPNWVACFQEVGQYWWIVSQWKTTSIMQKKAPKQNPPKFQNLSLGINLIFPRLWSFHSGKKRVRASEVLSLNWLLWKIPKEITLVILIFFKCIVTFSNLCIFIWTLITEDKSNALIVVYSFVLYLPCRNENNFGFKCQHTGFLVSFFSCFC